MINGYYEVLISRLQPLIGPKYLELEIRIFHTRIERVVRYTNEDCSAKKSLEETNEETWKKKKQAGSGSRLRPITCRIQIARRKRARLALGISPL